EQQGVTDLAGGAGDGDANGLLAHGGSPKEGCEYGSREGRGEAAVGLADSVRVYPWLRGWSICLMSYIRYH
ncbi:MAG TPA: hypothetical protein VNB23_13610, partial [Ramlibacter sp.]|nr:hypothetical protein [Ramlibacter sp.]